jgi:hypothetical protein
MANLQVRNNQAEVKTQRVAVRTAEKPEGDKAEA